MPNALQVQGHTSRGPTVQALNTDLAQLNEEHSLKAKTQGQESTKLEASSIPHKRVTHFFLG